MEGLSEKEYKWAKLYFNLYDLFGYLAPGFIFLFGVFALGYRYCIVYSLSGYDLSNNLDFLGRWYVIIAVLIISYILGNVLSAVGKIFERVNFLGVRDIPRFLFTGPESGFFEYKKGASKALLRRFSRRYYTLFLKRIYEYKGEDYHSFLVELLGNRKKLRYSDIIWDSEKYLLYAAPSHYYYAYSFLSLFGFFRTLTAVFFILGVYVLGGFLYSGFDAFGIFCLILFMCLTFLCFTRYVKFYRMNNYQIIRSFALFGDQKEEKKPLFKM